MFAIRRLLAQKTILKPHSFAGFLISKVEKSKIEKMAYFKFSDKIQDKNECLKRPISPHILIYKMELHMFASLCHRTTGIILSTYFLVFGIGTMLLSNDLEFYIQWVQDQNLPQWLIYSARSAFAFPFVVHAVGGLRHLIWDTALGLKTMKAVWIFSYLSFFTATAITAAVAMLKV